MNTFFSLFGKVVIVLVAVGALIAGGYYIGTKGLNKNTATVVTVTPGSMTTQTTTSTPTPITQKDNTGRFAVNAGGASGTSFANATYMLSGVAGWTLAKTEQPG